MWLDTKSVLCELIINRNMLLHLFLIFTKIGMFTIGGGYAVIPLIEKDLVQKKWLSNQEFYELIAITESLPGVFATNIAALVGYKIAGIKGALIAGLATIIAPFILLLIIAIFLAQFQQNIYVAKAFKALRPIVVALIAAPCYTAIKANKMTTKTLILPCIALALMFFAGLSPIWIILLGSISGIIYHSIIIKS
ncbi:chromate transporter [Myroides sp. LJL115]